MSGPKINVYSLTPAQRAAIQEQLRMRREQIEKERIERERNHQEPPWGCSEEYEDGYDDQSY